jgi:PIN domain nuclease of toxin-antitoxin system
VKLLLDTHVFLWWRLDSRRLRRAARETIATGEIVWVSAASAWEIAIKRTLGRLTLDEPFASMVEDSDFSALDITGAHAERTGVLPAHHADPFDRMLVAQALVEGATLMTHDRQLQAYDVPIFWA